MAKFVAVVGALVATQGAAALQTRVVPERQFPAPDVCHPMGTITFDTTFPPCLSQGEIEGKCAPVTKDKAGWAKQRDCMCKGSFFEDAMGCGACKQCNALQGHQETSHWNKIFKDVQANFCNEATPTSDFGAFWTAALAAHGSPVATPNDKRALASRCHFHCHCHCHFHCHFHCHRHFDPQLRRRRDQPCPGRRRRSQRNRG
ncbi:hypothetical protein G6O67_006543 [Ophiocordyceps sinensis]|uniref:Uncharacterized protein n=1 Tax=Ophiocordyceps sinensis TaxID=72228 RepID=A0A8H4LVV2_9HYPO|nr:hypothetical protein G6O67_006543 [Ophiocordyceps sinensis]